MNWITQISMVVALSALVLFVEHWFPWQHIIRKPHLPLVVNYVIGTLAYLVPFSLLLAGLFGPVEASPREILVGLWIVVAASGLAVVLAYQVDRCVRWFARLLDDAERVGHYEQGQTDERGSGTA